VTRGERDPRGSAGQALVDAGQLAALWTIAVAQPLFELVKDGEVFALARWRAVDVLTFALAFALLPPAVMMLLEVLAGHVRRQFRAWLHAAFVGGLVAIFAAYVLKRIDFSPGALFLAPLSAGVAAAVGYSRVPGVRTFCTALIPAPFVALFLLLVVSPTHAIVFSPDVGAARVRVERPGPVVLILFDEFPSLSLMNRELRIDAHSYPHFAELASDATWYRHATTVHDATHRAVPAIVTGSYAGDRVPSWAGYPRNLFTLLAGTYRMEVQELLPLCPPAFCPDWADRAFPRRFIRPLPALGKLSLNTFLPHRLMNELPEPHPLPKPPTAEQEFRVLERAMPAHRPTLYFVHALIPHTPWLFLPSGKATNSPSCCLADAFPRLGFDPHLGLARVADDTWTRNSRVVATAHQAHLEQARYADKLLGAIVRRLKRTAMYRRSMIVVTADHGISFRPGYPARPRVRGNAAQVLGVPLLIKLPFQKRGRISDRHAQTIDIVPTIADALGIRIPWRTDSRSLLQPAPDRRRLISYGAFTGQRSSLSSHAFDRALAVTARRFDRQFGPDAKGYELYRFGPDQGLAGTQLDVLPVGRRRSASARMDDPASYRSVDLRSTTIPTTVSGRLLGPDANRFQRLAIAVNGMIAVTTYSYPSVEGRRFSIRVPVSSLRPRANAIRIFGITGRSGHPRLIPL
jgi:hypothetical protein